MNCTKFIPLSRPQQFSHIIASYFLTLELGKCFMALFIYTCIRDKLKSVVSSRTEFQSTFLIIAENVGSIQTNPWYHFRGIGGRNVKLWKKNSFALPWLRTTREKVPSRTEQRKLKIWNLKSKTKVPWIGRATYLLIPSLDKYTNRVHYYTIAFLQTSSTNPRLG